VVCIRPPAKKVWPAVALASVLAAACASPSGNAAQLKESIESIGNEMIALHEPRRGVAYHDRSGKPFWVAFIPPQADERALEAVGIGDAGLARCRQPGLTVVAVGHTERTECAALARLSVPELRVLRKAAGETLDMTLALDERGYRMVAAR